MTGESSAPLAGPELIDPALYARDGYPHETWTRLRREAPVYHFEGPDYPFWALSRQKEIVEVSRQPYLFSNRPRFQIMVGADYGSADDREPETIIHMDPPRHHRYRDLLRRRFTPRAVQGLESAIAAIARESLDGLAAEGLEGECDAVERIASPLPMGVIAWMLDVPRADWPQLQQWTDSVVGATDPEYQRPGESAHETRLRASNELYEYFADLAKERRQGDGDDLVSVLARAEVDGAPLTTRELLSYFLFLVAGGTETTRNAISGGLVAFLDHPDQWQQLVEDPSLAKRASEEILRWSTPVIQMARTAVEDVELAGQPIRAGETLALFYGSANRDEQVFDEPFRFDIRRDPNPHLALGVGEHFCMGAHLARLELRVMFRQLAERFREIEPAGPVERLQSSSTGGVKALPIRYRMNSETKESRA
ncbi:MAG: cytochrome P450 [Deltaproteobacteria bacterium]|nr:cytochrome P450 [Deltaproteobacteria bacterium]